MTGKEIAEVAVEADSIPRVVRAVLSGAPFKHVTKPRIRVQKALKRRGVTFPNAEWIKAKPRGRTAPKS